MSAFTVTNDAITLCFNDRLVVWKRIHSIGLEEEQVFHIATEKSEEETPQINDGSVPIVCSATSPLSQYFAVCTNKTINLWDAKTWTLMGSGSLIRAASCVSFSRSKEDKIVVSDKSGDAYLYRVGDFNADHLAKGELLLGHVSMLLKIVISPDNKYVITCDRDEKIRISRFPNAYNIEAFCLGHTDCVTCLDFPLSRDDILISGGTDGTIRLWQYATGKQLLKYDYTTESDCAVIIDLKSIPLNSTSFLIFVIVNNSSNIRLLSVDHSTDSPTCSYVKDVPASCSAPRALAVNGNELFVLSYEQPHFITAFKLDGHSIVENTELDRNLKDVTRKFSDLFVSIQDLSPEDRLLPYLNKRKLDDTQEYYKRKNERLSGKEKIKC